LCVGAHQSKSISEYDRRKMASYGEDGLDKMLNNAAGQRSITIHHSRSKS